ncbi:MAG: ATP-dependent zinc metalloprotease FtsH [Candidatus Metalachnospira sp.]|nr:ATP-dependent zinc metalloprotease FtsH [Candidatus Metalachnospira sp.]
MLYAVIFLTIIGVMAFSNTGMGTASGTVEYTYNQLVESLDNGKIKSISLQRKTDVDNYGTATVTFSDATVAKVTIPSVSTFMNILHETGADESIQITPTDIPSTGFFMSILPSIILMVIAIIIFMVMFQKMQGGGGGKMMSFGKSNAKVTVDDKNKVTFQDVAGLEEEKFELQEIVDFLKDSRKYIELGARIPKGVLLVGPPGTGKTLIAKAVAGEAGVPFFSISGSDFVEMFVGVGASRVRDLFEQAKKNAPCIVFIDEIDAVGRRRGAGLGGGHDEREQTLNQLLVEMDGFGINEGVIIMAATNRADILDPAILRPGRFDRQVYVGRPDVKGREAILEVHSKGKPLADDVDLKVVAKTTSGFTGADLENLLNEAALLSARAGKKKIDMQEIQQAFVKIGIGTEKKSRIISDKEKLITAYHESGHAILFEKLEKCDPVHSVSIIPTGMAGGYTMPLPGEDKMYITKGQMQDEIISFLGGRAAEEIVLKDITTGASNDIERATKIARSIVMKYGMSDKFGPVQYGDEGDEVFIGRDIGHTRNYSENTADQIDAEVKEILNFSYKEAKRILKENISILHASAKLLMEKEKITGDEFRALFITGETKENDAPADTQQMM